MQTRNKQPRQPGQEGASSSSSSGSGEATGDDESCAGPDSSSSSSSTSTSASTSSTSSSTVHGVGAADDATGADGSAQTDSPPSSMLEVRAFFAARSFVALRALRTKAWSADSPPPSHLALFRRHYHQTTCDPSPNHPLTKARRPPCPNAGGTEAPRGLSQNTPSPPLSAP